MKPSWRGVVVDGVVWAWPTLLLDHKEAFVTLPFLSKYSARWRQWETGAPIDFDPGTSQEDKELVEAWMEKVEV